MKPFNSHGQSFTEIPVGAPDKSSFDLSFTNKGSGKLGQLIPICCKELLPADNFRLDTKALLRFEPLAVPMLSACKLRKHAYKVPFRQVWSDWEEFITRGKDNSIDRKVPSLSLSNALRAFFYPMWANTVLLSDFNDPLYVNLSNEAKQTIECYYEWISSVFQKTSTPLLPALQGGGNFYNNILYLGIQWLNTYNTADGFMPGITPSDFEAAPEEMSINVFAAFSFLVFLQLYYFGCFDSWPNYSSIQSIFSNKVEDNANGQSLCADDIYDYIMRPLADEVMTMLLSLFDWSVLDGSNHPAFITTNKRVDYVPILARCTYLSFGVHFGPSSIWDYLGYPVLTFEKWFYVTGLLDPNGSNTVDRIGLNFSNPLYTGFDTFTRFSVLPLRALYRIWWYNYRDQRIEANAVDPDDSYSKRSALDEPAFDWWLLTPRFVAWSKDTFTTATLESFSSNMVVPLGEDKNPQTIQVMVEQGLDVSGQIQTASVPMAIPRSCLGQGYDLTKPVMTGLSLSMLRKCESLAQWLDKNLFLGYQYADQLYSHYGVKYSDARLQIPEYIGGSSSVVGIEVITNNTTTAEDVAGSQCSRMQGYDEVHTDDNFVEEHGLVFVLMSVLPEQSYPEAVDRSLLMHDTFDIAFPEFAQTGSDVVSAAEVAFNPLFDPRNIMPFGYQGRYYHYKSNVDQQHGLLNTSMREYTFARYFFKGWENSRNTGDNGYHLPCLTPKFIHCLPNKDMFVSEIDDQFIYDILIGYKSQRALPVFDQVL